MQNILLCFYNLNHKQNGDCMGISTRMVENYAIRYVACGGGRSRIGLVMVAMQMGLGRRSESIVCHSYHITDVESMAKRINPAKYELGAYRAFQL